MGQSINSGVKYLLLRLNLSHSVKRFDERYIDEGRKERREVEGTHSSSTLLTRYPGVVLSKCRVSSTSDGIHKGRSRYMEVRDVFVVRAYNDDDHDDKYNDGS